jgi:pimeloyl-ACP methyl ester carboxylesterase
MSGHRWLVLLAICGACRTDRPTTPAPWRDASPHAVRMVGIAPRTSLEVLDWGGTGRPLVLLTGLGNTAHVFDDFAPSLTDSFHVYGITRRGFGRSSQPPASDLTTLVSDLRIVLDSLRLSRVILVGHSIAGDELTGFAVSHPDRCDALVYLDAAYDRSARSQLSKVLKNSPRPPAMTTADSASPTALTTYAARVVGVPFPEADVRATSRFDSSGKYVGDVTSDSLAYLILRRLPSPAYQRLTCPSLAIYAYSAVDSASRAQAQHVDTMYRAFARASRTQYQHNAPFAHVVEIYNAHHYVFLSNRAETLSAMRAFLGHAR